MSCFYPISLKPKFIVDDVTGEILKDDPGRNVPCGKCAGCLNQRRSTWTHRIKEELKVSKSGRFVTLTYSDKSIPYVKSIFKKLPTLKKRDLQLYVKRIRKEVPEVRYYGVGEYGSNTNRPHYHLIICNVPDEVITEKWSKGKDPIGFVHLDPCDDALVHYITKYILNTKKKDHKKDDPEEPFALMSKGLGKNYIYEAGTYHRNNKTGLSVSTGGIKFNISRYYKDKIFTKEEKAEIAERSKIEIRKNLESKSHSKILNERKAIKIKAIRNSKSNVV